MKNNTNNELNNNKQTYNFFIYSCGIHTLLLILLLISLHDKKITLQSQNQQKITTYFLNNKQNNKIKINNNTSKTIIKPEKKTPQEIVTLSTPMIIKSGASKDNSLLDNKAQQIQINKKESTQEENKKIQNNNQSDKNKNDTSIDKQENTNITNFLAQKIQTLSTNIETMQNKPINTSLITEESTNPSLLPLSVINSSRPNKKNITAIQNTDNNNTDNNDKKQKDTQTNELPSNNLKLADLFHNVHQHMIINNENHNIHGNGSGSNHNLVITQGNIKYYSFIQKLLVHINQSAKFNIKYNNLDITSLIKTGKIKHNMQFALIINSNGIIQNIEVLHSSGNNEFDQMTLENIKNAQPLPPIPRYFNHEVVRIELTTML